MEYVRGTEHAGDPMPRPTRILAHLLLTTTIWAAAGCGGADLGPLRLDRFAAIGADSGAAAIPTWPRVSARHPGGFRVVVPQPGSATFRPLVYDDGGNFLGPMTGPTGPNGFVQPTFARLGPGDSIWVFDAANRVLVFDPARRYRRTVRLPLAPWDAVVLGDGRLAVTSAAYGAPLPWLLLAADGSVVRRIGRHDRESPSSPRRITRAPDGTLWTAPMTHRFRLEHWDTTGALLSHFEPTTEWYPPYDRLESPSADRAPQPSVQDLWVAADGAVGVLGKAADPDWPAGLGAPIDGVAGILRPDQVYDTVIEVRDPTTGAVISSARFDISYPFTAGPGVIMRPVVIEGGWFRAELASVRLVK
jgi:hypothetical protein